LPPLIPWLFAFVVKHICGPWAILHSIDALNNNNNNNSAECSFDIAVEFELRFYVELDKTGHLEDVLPSQSLG